jgi:hypothetical protein
MSEQAEAALMQQMLDYCQKDVDITTRVHKSAVGRYGRCPTVGFLTRLAQGDWVQHNRTKRFGQVSSDKDAAQTVWTVRWYDKYPGDVHFSYLTHEYESNMRKLPDLERLAREAGDWSEDV